jgi:hypothetical protein
MDIIFVFMNVYIKNVEYIENVICWLITGLDKIEPPR